MKKALISMLLLSSIANGRAVADPIEYTSTAEAFYQASHKIVKHATKEHVTSVYGKESGFLSVTDRVVEDIKGKKFLYVNMKGDGDCCFHSLGVSRQEMLNRLERYIIANEGALGEIPQERRDEYERIDNLLAGYKGQIDGRSEEDFRSADFLDKDSKMKAYVDKYLLGDQNGLKSIISGAWRELRDAQSRDSVNWELISTQIDNLIAEFQKANAEILKVKTYREFLQSCEATFWEEVGADALLAQIGYFMRDADHKTLKDDEGNPLKLMRWDGSILINDINPYIAELNQYLSRRTAAVGAKSGLKAVSKSIKLSSLQIESINAKLQFAGGSVEDKLKILKRFYGTCKSGGRNVWFDPAALTPIADQLMLKFKIYKLVTNEAAGTIGRYYVAAASPNANEEGEPKLRRLYHTGGHYDLLVPLVPGI